ncbi:MAG: SURF1 family protein [Gemmatimonadota bacterium]|nr:SURF1 family protein [Gemmatimonadota bacterium]
MSGSSLRAIFLVAAVTVVAGVCVRLGFWQLDRLETRRASNARILAAAELPPLVLDRAGLDSIAEFPDRNLFRQAVATGVFETDDEVILRGRSHDGRPGVHLVTPFRLDSGGLILVNRGWLPSPDAASADPRPYRDAGHTRLVGSLQLLPRSTEDSSPLILEVDGYPVRTFRRLDADSIAALTGESLPPLYLQLLPGLMDSPATPPIPVPLPSLDEGPHLGYAIQWFSFAAIAVLGLTIVAWRGKVRKKQ